MNINVFFSGRNVQRSTDQAKRINFHPAVLAAFPQCCTARTDRLSWRVRGCAARKQDDACFAAGLASSIIVRPVTGNSGVEGEQSYSTAFIPLPVQTIREGGGTPGIPLISSCSELTTYWAPAIRRKLTIGEPVLGSQDFND